MCSLCFFTFQICPSLYQFIDANYTDMDNYMDANHSFLPKYESFDYGNDANATVKLENKHVQSQNVSLANSLKTLRSSSGQVFNEYNDFISNKSFYYFRRMAALHGVSAIFAQFVAKDSGGIHICASISSSTLGNGRINANIVKRHSDEHAISKSIVAQVFAFS